MQAFGAVLGVANEAGAKWRVLAEGICLWEVGRDPHDTYSDHTRANLAVLHRLPLNVKSKPSLLAEH